MEIISLFVLGNWIGCILTSLLLVGLLSRDRSLLLKPSFVFVVVFHLRVQWAGTLNAWTVESSLPEPLVFAALLNGFPFLVVIASSVTTRRVARATWRRLVGADVEIRPPAVVILAALAVLIVAYYLLYEPLSESGLWVLITDPLQSPQAREESLKLLDDQAVRYAFATLRSVVGPLLGVLAAQLLVTAWRQRRLALGTVAIVLIVFVLIAVSLPGSRAAATQILMAIIVSRLLFQGLPRRPLAWIVGGVALLSVPAVMTILREERELDLASYFEYLGWMALRTFEKPAEVAFWYVHYAQTVGHFGVAAVPRLAALAGVVPVDADNVIGLAYAAARIKSISAGTCFVFSYYSYFGLVSIIASLILVLLLDVVVCVYPLIGRQMLLPLVSAITVAATTLVESDFTIIVFTNGLATLIVTAIALDRMSRPRFSSPGQVGRVFSRAG